MCASLLPSVFTLENDQLALTMVREGAKLTRLLDRRTGQHWLLPSQASDKSRSKLRYGADFSEVDPSGFDECLPNVSECPHPNAALRWPDHGEVWSRPWHIQRDNDGLSCRIDGQAWPYRFHRRVSLDGDALCLDYSLRNLAPEPFHCLWSAHPLLCVTPGMKIILPKSVKEAFVNWASDPVLGSFGEIRPWPDLGSGLDLSTVQDPERGVAVKLFVPSIAEGWCSLADPDQGRALTFEWDTNQVPHLGIWLCYGGWPMDGMPGHLTVALEPCTGMPDSLHEAQRLGQCPVLGPDKKRDWHLRIRSHLISNSTSFPE